MTCISWVMNTMVTPRFSLFSFKSSRMERVVLGSRALVASSQRRIFGLGGKGAGYGHCAASVRRTAGMGVRLFKSDHFQKPSAGPGRRPFSRPRFPKESTRFQHGPLLQQVEALENHSDGRTFKSSFGKPGQILSVQQHLAAGGFLQQVYAPHQRGFARAGKADDAEYLAVVYGEVYVLQRLHRLPELLYVLLEILNFYHCWLFIFQSKIK